MVSVAAALKTQLEAIGVFPAPKILTAFESLLEELYRWNASINLTAVRSSLEAVEKHIIDSLTLLPFLVNAENLLDAGSGAGFPGIPIKLCRPDLTVFSVEASRKKVYFQREMVRRLKLQNFFPLPVRLESIRSEFPDLPPLDVIVSRALGPGLDLARSTAGLLGESGRLILMKGSGGEREVFDWPVEETGLSLLGIHELKLPESGATRKIVVFGRNCR